jgi:hypothetical protein
LQWKERQTWCRVPRQLPDRRIFPALPRALALQCPCHS